MMSSDVNHIRRECDELFPAFALELVRENVDVERPAGFEMIVNIKTVTVLGVSVLDTMLVHVDKVIR